MTKKFGKNSIITAVLAVLFISVLNIIDVKQVKNNNDYSSIFVASYYSTNRL